MGQCGCVLWLLNITVLFTPLFLLSGHINVSRKTKFDMIPESKPSLSTGQLSMEDVPVMILCKPKLLPLKSVTLEKLEKMQLDAQEAIRQQEAAAREQQQ